MSTATLAKPMVEPIPIGDDELYEVVDGKRIRTPPMGIYAVWLATRMYRYLGVFAETHDLGHGVIEGLFHLPAPINRDRRPDMAFVSYARWPKARSIPLFDNAWNVVPN